MSYKLTSTHLPNVFTLTSIGFHRCNEVVVKCFRIFQYCSSKNTLYLS